MSLVISVEPDLLESFIEAVLEESGFEELSPAKNELFRVGKDNLIIMGYSSGRIVANRIDAQPILLQVLRRLKPSPDARVTVGSDEAGKGEWLGPMTVSAVGLDNDLALEFQSFGVMDSKELSSDRIKYLSDIIRDRALAYEEVLITPRKFNTLVTDLSTEAKSLNELLAWGHATAVDQVVSQVLQMQTPGRGFLVVIDEFDRFATERRLQRIMQRADVELFQQPSAEINPAVAAASIIARDAREQWIDRRSHGLGIDLRHLSPGDAMQRGDFHELAKISYLSSLVGPLGLLESARSALDTGNWDVAVMTSWIGIEFAMSDRGYKPTQSGRIRRFGKALSLRSTTIQDLTWAQEVRDQVAHEKRKANEEEARRFVSLLERILEKL